MNNPSQLPDPIAGRLDSSQAAGQEGEALRLAIDSLADQLCVAVDGNFDIMVRSPLEDETLEKLAMLVNFVLDTARRGMTALREHNDALAQLDQAKSSFFSNASHELRTPLTLLLGPLEDAIARGGALDGVPLTAAYRNATRLLKLVNALLDFSRIEAGGLKAVCAPVDLAALTCDVASLFRTAVEAAGLRFEVSCPPAARAVLVDADMWEKIVANLLSNAFKFTAQGGIVVRLQQTGSEAVLEVADSGIGIDASQVDNLFKRFHRIDSTWARTHEGSGIGLAMVHQLARLHGGRIEVASRLQEGSVFRVVLPLEATDRPPRALNGAAMSHAGLASIGEMQAWDAPMVPHAGFPAGTDRILVADDNADLRAYLARILSPHWTVELCADGRQALAAATRSVPSLVVCDVMMPHMSGLELLRALRSQEATSAVPVILVSARADPASVDDGFDFGSDDYMVKPFSSRELVTRVRSRLELARARARLAEQQRAAREEAEAANRAKDRFLAMLGHELRNPLAPIVNSLHVMNLKGDPGTRRERDIIARQVDQIITLVNDLMDTARVAQGNVSLRIEKTNLAAIVAKAVETSAPILEARRHELVTDLPDTLFVQADANRLCQVVLNLVTNAAKYTDPGGRIEITGCADGAEILLRVRDNGIGIDAKLLSTVFDAFVQVEQSIERSGGGLGLGLSIVSGLVRLHGGSVTAHSEGLGRGTEIRVRLPATPDAASSLRFSVAAAPAPATTIHPMRVLVVDDNEDAASTLAAGLTLLGHEVAIANDGAAGLRIVAEFHPDVALLDLGLPMLDGYELARRILALPGLTPALVALSGYGEPQDIEKGRQAGFVGHLVKPVDLDAVAASIENAAHPPETRH